LAQAKHDVYGVTRSKSSASATAKEAGYKASAHWMGFVEADADKPETLPAAVAGADVVSAAAELKGCTK
jgi:nucleoside-diphosphate-sugar epimerase